MLLYFFTLRKMTKKNPTYIVFHFLILSMVKFEVFCEVISSNINLLLLKNGQEVKKNLASKLKCTVLRICLLCLCTFFVHLDT